MHVWHDKFDLDKTFFFSDPHYHHKNICAGVSNWDDKSACRDFGTIEEMNEAIVNSINNNVDEKDILFCLGDWSFGNKTNVREFRSKVNCKKIILIYGNHDNRIRWNNDLRNAFYWCGDYLEICARKDQGETPPSLLILTHYAMRVWNSSHHGSINLFGHSHGTLPAEGKQMDVGWDNWKRPLSLREILVKLEDVDANIIDHHNECTS